MDMERYYHTLALRYGQASKSVNKRGKNIIPIYLTSRLLVKIKILWIVLMTIYSCMNDNIRSMNPKERSSKRQSPNLIFGNIKKYLINNFYTKKPRESNHDHLEQNGFTTVYSDEIPEICSSSDEELSDYDVDTLIKHHYESPSRESTPVQQKYPFSYIEFCMKNYIKNSDVNDNDKDELVLLIRKFAVENFEKGKKDGYEYGKNEGYDIGYKEGYEKGALYEESKKWSQISKLISSVTLSSIFLKIGICKPNIIDYTPDFVTSLNSSMENKLKKAIFHTP